MTVECLRPFTMPTSRTKSDSIYSNVSSRNRTARNQESSRSEGMVHFKTYTDLTELGYSGAVRPKSSPIPGHKSAKSGKLHRPKTAAAVLFQNPCERVNQLEHEPTRRQNFESHLPSKKNRPPVWQKHLDPPLVPVSVGPGYILSRSKSQCNMLMKDEFFEQQPGSINQPVSHGIRKKIIQGDPERDSLISQLQQQVNDLTLYLEEERLNHKQTKQKADEYLKDKISDLTKQYKNQIKDLQQEHRYNLENLKKQKDQELEDYKEKTEQKMHKMVTEIEFLQGAFESYKGTLDKETEEKILQKEEDLKKQFELEKIEAFQDFKSKVIQEKVSDKSSVTKDFQKQREAMKREHKKEIESLTRRYATAAADMDRLKKVATELDEVKSELDEVKTRYSETCSQLNTTSRLLTDTKVKLLEYQERFADKVELIDDKYKAKMDELMRQNTELRQLYVKKCGQLFEEKALTERDLFDRVSSAKQTMEELIKVKERANVSLIANDPDLEKRARKPKKRPCSAPTTSKEGERAHLSAGETDHLFPLEEFIRPDSILPDLNPEIEKMREELYSQGVREYSKEDLLNVLQS